MPFFKFLNFLNFFSFLNQFFWNCPDFWKKNRRLNSLFQKNFNFFSFFTIFDNFLRWAWCIPPTLPPCVHQSLQQKLFKGWNRYSNGSSWKKNYLHFAWEEKKNSIAKSWKKKSILWNNFAFEWTQFKVKSSRNQKYCLYEIHLSFEMKQFFFFFFLKI